LLRQDTTRTWKLGEVTVTAKADVISMRLAGFERRRLLKPGSVTFSPGDEVSERG
jgi:hypothetical protein